jgi:hypothetical protein
MQQYKIKPNAADPMRLLVQAFAILTYLSIFLFLAALIKSNEIIFVIFVICLAFSMGTFYVIDKKQKALFESYTLCITEDSITRYQLNTPTITILKSEITIIFKGKYGDMAIFGNNQWNRISIPPQIDDYAALEEQLNSILPFTTEIKIPLKNRILGNLFAIASGAPLLMTFWWAETKMQLIISGTLGIIMFIVQEFLNYWIKDRDSTSKKMSTVSNLMLTIMIFMEIYSKLKAIH